jgi:GTP-binding protein HflX
VDAASANRDEQITQVNHVLQEIGATDVRQVLVLNQIDRLGMEPGLERDEYGRIRTIRISAMTGAGMDLVKQVMVEHQQSILKKSMAISGSSLSEEPDESLKLEQIN